LALEVVTGLLHAHGHFTIEKEQLYPFDRRLDEPQTFWRREEYIAAGIGLYISTPRAVIRVYIANCCDVSTSVRTCVLTHHMGYFIRTQMGAYTSYTVELGYYFMKGTEYFVPL
jgi:hypothetical protein